MSKKFWFSTVDLIDPMCLGGLNSWTWGPVVKVHEFPPLGIAVIEFKARIYKDGHGTGEYGKTSSYQPFVDGKSCIEGTDTMERALLVALAHRSFGASEALNNRSVHYAAMILGLK